ncbi:MAG TPA: MFS transporter [Opitutales bacterium]|nr:MFS transporter [Opitutales bacterium]
MEQKRWIRIIPIALVMYTIAYVDRTNVSLCLDPHISTMMSDLLMDDKLKGEAVGVFFYGYMLLQMPGGFFASRWSARKVISLCLLFWGVSAVGCGLAHSVGQFEVMRFLLGMSESAIFPATAVLLTQWFPKAERARANSLWLLCQPLAVAGAAPITGKLLDALNWRYTLVLEGALPFLWLPVWWFCIRDHPSEAKWISLEERNHLEETLRKEAAESEPPQPVPLRKRLVQPSLYVMIVFYFLHNCSAYGLMTFFTDTLKGYGFTGLQYGLLFALPYAVTAVLMVVNSWHSDKTKERHGHTAIAYFIGGLGLILSVVYRNHFWLSYVFLCSAVPAPFVGMCPFWALIAETIPKSVLGFTIGLVNAFGNLGGAVGPSLVGWMSKEYKSTDVAFIALGVGTMACAGLAFMLPRPKTLASILPPVKPLH